MTLLFQLCLSFILPLSVVSAGVLHHREHANPLGQFGGQAANYVESVDSDDEAGEKLRVIKITRTYAIPYPVPIPYPKQIPVPVPVTRRVPYAILHPVAIPVPKPILVHPQYVGGAFQSAADQRKTAAYFHTTPQHTYAVHQNLDHDIPNGQDDAPTTENHGANRDSSQSSILAYSSSLGKYKQNLDDRFGNSDGRPSAEFDHSKFSKPFQPSPEYTPPELNQPLFSQFSQYQPQYSN
ncbi:Hypothetical protein NTJ_13929 [Nesidiocoris tenuis]|uniref:DUF4794 domain-containing protein n=1 Tax=Nesidiocoris tenuis TaxID=355587 RepID=A0ABN7B9P8_9HEMI|nr:Hypothetical protein NTJ_13929 [Nesidiocoris tenuis]